jgi:C1A family cysteine protease
MMHLTVKIIVVALFAIGCSMLAELKADEQIGERGETGPGKVEPHLGCDPDAIASRSVALPPTVDLRPEFSRLGLIQRSQGERGTCSVFATVEAVEFAVAQLRGKGESLSIEFANWAANAATGRSDDGDFFRNIIRGLQTYGVCSEAAMPYAAAFASDARPGEAAVADAKQLQDKIQLSFHWLKRWNKSPGLTDDDLQQVKQVLACGYPVSAGSYHSVLFVGYEDSATYGGGGRLFISDSNLQETEISYEAAKARFCDMFWVTAVAATSPSSVSK